MPTEQMDCQFGTATVRFPEIERRDPAPMREMSRVFEKNQLIPPKHLRIRLLSGLLEKDWI